MKVRWTFSVCQMELVANAFGAIGSVYTAEARGAERVSDASRAEGDKERPAGRLTDCPRKLPVRRRSRSIMLSSHVSRP